MIREKRESDFTVIDLTGPDGNAFALMAYVKNFGKQLDIDWKSIIEEMRSGDYEHLINVFDTHFGDFVILER